MSAGAFNKSLGRLATRVSHLTMLVLSLALIIYISVDTFSGTNFLTNRNYMTFQFWVCLFFILDFFIGLWASPNRWRYFRHRWPFLLISIPYLNIITHFNIALDPTEVYFVRFIPLTRSVYALALEVGYLSVHRISSLLASYIVIMVSLIYTSSLIFFYEEQAVNPLVPDYWEALWWACMNSTTLGCYIYPVTAIGKVLSCALAVMGTIMFPLFTVYVTSVIKRYAAGRAAS